MRRKLNKKYYIIEQEVALINNGGLYVKIL